MSGRDATFFLRLSLPMVHERRRSRVGPGEDVYVGKNDEPTQREDAQWKPDEQDAPEENTGHLASAG